MSGTLSAAVRFENQVGPVVSTPTTRLQDLVATMRLSVVRATEATEVAAKVELWESYRAARAEALALLVPGSNTSDSRHLHSL
jgi:hypothetical protein